MKKIKITLIRDYEIWVKSRTVCHPKCPQKDKNFEGFCCLFEQFLFYTDDKKDRERYQDCIDAEELDGD